jgi:hypothetical protein
MHAFAPSPQPSPKGRGQNMSALSGLINPPANAGGTDLVDPDLTVAAIASRSFGPHQPTVPNIRTTTKFLS